MNYDIIKTINHIRNTVFEIRDLFCAPTGCIAFEKHAPGCVSMGSFLINFLHNHIENLKKSMHLPKCAHQVQGAPSISNTGSCMGFV